MRAIVLADGEAVTRAGLEAAWPGWDRDVELVIAADGGARLADPLGISIDQWVGDGDSIEPAVEERLRVLGVPMRRAPQAKDESDTELALLAALDGGASDVTIIGALGGPRFDHAVANVGLLSHPRLAVGEARLLGPTTRVTLLTGPDSREFAGRPGDIVSLLPFGADVEGVTTEGLVYPLRGEALGAGPARGLSNARTGDLARVHVGSGRLLVIEIRATFEP